MVSGSLFALPDFGPWRLDQGDAVEWLRALPDESVDCIITDPAYESLEKHRAKGTTTRLKHSKSSSNDWFPIFGNHRFPDLFREMYRVLAQNSHLYLYCDAETMFVAKPLGESAGLKFWKPLVFDKQAIGMGYHYRATYEFVLFFEKGKRKLADLGQSDILRFKRIVGGFPTEKPQALNEVLVRQSTSRGEVVLDCFSGSGSTGAAAVRLGRRFIGCDVQQEAVTIGRARLAQTFADSMVAPAEVGT
jgi:site-specific DNA-methyltransferase (adenine-specific)